MDIFRLLTSAYHSKLTLSRSVGLKIRMNQLIMKLDGKSVFVCGFYTVVQFLTELYENF